MAEYWDAYDRLFNKIENVTLIRGEPIPEGMFHYVCEIMVQHTDGTYLVMRRDYDKNFGGLWEMSAGGSVQKGETPVEGAIRELKEETGINVSEMTELFKFFNDPYNSIHIAFMCETDCDKNSVTLQEGETIAYKWMTKEEFLKLKVEEVFPTRLSKFFRNGKI